MAKLLPVILLAVFLTFVIASFYDHPYKPASNNAPPAANSPLKKYWMVILREGQPAADPQLQQQHNACVQQLTAEGKMLAAGTLGGAQSLQGMYILNCADSLEAVQLLSRDAAVTAGALTAEIQPWFTSENCLFK